MIKVPVHPTPAEQWTNTGLLYSYKGFKHIFIRCSILWNSSFSIVSWSGQSEKWNYTTCLSTESFFIVIIHFTKSSLKVSSTQLTTYEVFSQYLLHFVTSLPFLFSFKAVSIIITSTLYSSTISQKSSIVESRGPWAAIN